MQLPDFFFVHLFFALYFFIASILSGYALYIGVKSYVELRKLEKRQKSFLKRCLQQTQKPSKWLLNLLTPESNECKARMSIDLQANAEKVRKIIKSEIEKHGGLRKFFRAQNYKHLNLGEISFFVRGIREPTGILKRREIGLPIRQNVPVCPQCGVAHVRVCKQPFEVRCKDEGVVRMLKVLHYLEDKNLGSRQK